MEKNARTSRAGELVAGWFFGFTRHLRQEVIAFLQVSSGIFPELPGHFRLLGVKATEALFLH